MSRHAFEIRPVASYQGARYPGVRPVAAHAGPDDGERKPGPVRLAFTAALILFISLGLVACFGDLQGKLNDRFPVIPSADAGGGDGGNGDDGGDVTLGVPVECTPGDVVCEDGDVLATCGDDYVHSRESCQALCEERYAASGEWGYTLGCDAAAKDPCRCEYDIVMGEMMVCTPGDLLCLDEATAGVCNDGENYDPVPCEAHCQATHGADYTSIGCDAQDPVNYCGCKPRDA